MASESQYALAYSGEQVEQAVRLINGDADLTSEQREALMGNIGVDGTPMQYSRNPVSSGGTYDMIMERAPYLYWTGSQEDYDLIAEPDPNTLYLIF